MIVAVDIDGILCYPVKYPNQNFIGAEPIKRNIEIVNRLAGKGHVITLYTSRRENESKHDTIQWLRINKVLYHRIVFDKLYADFYVDDRAIYLDILDSNLIGEWHE